MGCVYQAINLVNGKCYVGKTIKSLTRRISRHKNNAKEGSRNCFHRALAKYGFDNFKWNILFEGDDENYLFEIEKRFIKSLNTTAPSGYNLTDGGEGRSGNKPTPETKVKLHQAQLGNTKGRANKFRIFTPEAKEKMSVAAKRRGIPKEQRDKITAGLIGRECSDDTRKKISIANTGKKKPEGALAKAWATRRMRLSETLNEVHANG